MEDAQTKLFQDTGTFFAFSHQQFKSKAVEGVSYCSLDGGMFCPNDKAQELIEGLESIYKAGIKQDIEENGIDAIIERELYNHECFYTWETDDVIEKLEDYGITTEQINAKFRELAAQQQQD